MDIRKIFNLSSNKKKYKVDFLCMDDCIQKSEAKENFHGKYIDLSFILKPLYYIYRKAAFLLSGHGQ